jgi:hypothetical protein
MKFAFLLYEDESRWGAMSEAERDALIGRHMAYSAALEKAGVMAGGAPLEPTPGAKLITNGTIQDGPYADTKEQLGGFYMVEVDSLDAALTWAHQCPLMEGSSLEVRPVPNYGDGA